MDKLTKERAKEWLWLIEVNKSDYEAAHMHEDSLHHAFIESVAKGHYKTIEEASEVANVVLKSKEIEFQRLTA